MKKISLKNATEVQTNEETSAKVSTMNKYYVCIYEAKYLHYEVVAENEDEAMTKAIEEDGVEPYDTKTTCFEVTDCDCIEENCGEMPVDGVGLC